MERRDDAAMQPEVGPWRPPHGALFRVLAWALLIAIALGVAAMLVAVIY